MQGGRLKGGRLTNRGSTVIIQQSLVQGGF